MITINEASTVVQINEIDASCRFEGSNAISGGIA